MSGATKGVGTQTMLDRYWQRRNIDARQYHAGRRLYRHWRTAGGKPSTLLPSGWVLPKRDHRNISDDVFTKRGFVNVALRALGRHLSPVVIHVCLANESAGDWAAGRLLPQSDGIARLRAGLDALADHYRMPGGPDLPDAPY